MVSNTSAPSTAPPSSAGSPSRPITVVSTMPTIGSVMNARAAGSAMPNTARLETSKGCCGRDLPMASPAGAAAPAMNLAFADDFDADVGAARAGLDPIVIGKVDAGDVFAVAFLGEQTRFGVPLHQPCPYLVAVDVDEKRQIELRPHDVPRRLAQQQIIAFDHQQAHRGGDGEGIVDRILDLAGIAGAADRVVGTLQVGEERGK